MSSTTTNLGLTKPAYTDDADVAIINSNMDIIDTAYGSINQSTLRDVPFAVAVSDWSAVTGGFSATFNTAYITASSKEILTYDGSLASYAKAHILAAKKSGGGGLVFTTATKPTGTITGNVYVFDNDDNKLPVLIEDTVTPIANGGTGQSSLAGAQQALGITALNNQIANSQKIYRLNITAEEVTSSSYFKFSTSYLADSFVSVVNNNEIHFGNSANVLIIATISGKPATDRLWATMSGGNTTESVVSYGTYTTGVIVGLYSVDTNTVIKIQNSNSNSFTVGGGGIGGSQVKIIRL